MLAEAFSVKPILFSTPMVEAIVAGRKTQTRRIAKIDGIAKDGRFFKYKDVEIFNKDFTTTTITNKYVDEVKPKYSVGDILWVREKWRHNDIPTGFPYHHYADDTIYTDRDNEKWKPSLFMPKQACRLFLKITSVGVEKLQDISHEDAKAEGIEYIDIEEPFTMGYKLYGKHRIPDLLGRKAVTGTSIESYQTLWESINGQKSWDENPYVWVISFELLECPQGFC